MPEPPHKIGGNMGNSLDSVELLLEPDDPRILSAIDPSAVGFQDDWRAEITGWAPLKPTPITRVRGKRFMRQMEYCLRFLQYFCSGFGRQDILSLRCLLEILNGQ